MSSFDVQYNRTKVIATIGPASAHPDVLTELIEAGVDVCRLNFSHGGHDELQEIIEDIRKINKARKSHVCILCDLQGPKLRLGEIENGFTVWEKDDIVIFSTVPAMGTRLKVYITYQEFPKDVAIGDKILVDDGKLELQVVDTNRKDEVTAVVTYGGVVASKKGVNLPNTLISLPSLTEKDMEDLEFALKNDVEWVGLSFVRKPEDIIQLKEIILARKKKTRVIAKIEKPEAVRNIDEIIAVTDGIMVARGDLGVELPMEQVPLIQKKIVKRCMAASKPVIIATQMMESMITNPKPTRAEANDVANAVMDGADAVMLSAETSVGKYPIRVVEYMVKIISNIEADRAIYNVKYSLNKQSSTFLSDAVCLNAVLMSKEVNARAIISMTQSGYTALKISSFRPEAKVFIFSSDPQLLNAINLIWGVRGFLYDKYSTTDETFNDVIKLLKNEHYLDTGDLVINTASMPIHEKGRTNALKISVVE
ncbi:MAG: pyruvate kinase [Bacteroidota bacterium]|nr:pyruvate kinase [Bacteroidota bacterium]